MLYVHNIINVNINPNQLIFALIPNDIHCNLTFYQFKAIHVLLCYCILLYYELYFILTRSYSVTFTVTLLVSPRQAQRLLSQSVLQ